VQNMEGLRGLSVWWLLEVLGLSMLKCRKGGKGGGVEKEE